ncbi:hypothetical protein QBC44DRAFT_330146 [Cladorrhinum sp. PSN332]|nr:hypothetical protein QBC44DRAFT_330146 [Cladorrhinum sp. PSN332]
MGWEEHIFFFWPVIFRHLLLVLCFCLEFGGFVWDAFVFPIYFFFMAGFLLGFFFLVKGFWNGVRN